MTTADKGFLRSLSDSALESYLDELPTAVQTEILTELMTDSDPTFRDEREDQRQLMARKRAANRDLAISRPRNPERRAAALADPERFLCTYFPDEFYEAFTDDRRAMLASIIHAAKYGGDQAIAGPRGEGKTTLAMSAAVYLMLTGLSSFPVVIGKSQTKAQLELRALREKLQQSEIFIADFPEIGQPLQAIGAWSSRARMQTVEGINTNAVLAVDHLAFPTIRPEQLKWSEEIEPVSFGQVIYCLGIDGPIRGTKFRGQRPSLAIIDDIEDRESAASDVLIVKNEEVLERDIAGLGSGAERVSRAMLCTIQNRKCIAYQYTDPKQKPSWKGKRYRKMLTPPSRMDLVEEYISKRIEKSEDDPDAREAHRFWVENRELIESDCIVSNPQSHSKKIHLDGEPLEVSAIQAYYNRVADWGKDAVATEIDNDPPESMGPQGMGLTASIVSSRLSGLSRLQLPANTTALTAAIDLGKYRCHWVVTAWWKGAGGCVVDYGVAEVTGTDRNIDNEASEPQVYKALLNWRDELLQKEYVDASGERRKVENVFVDAGTFTNAAYEFTRQVGPPFFPAKGIGKYRHKTKSTDTLKAGDNMHASWLAESKLWLFELNTDYWKQWVHERFMSPTFDEDNMLRRGAMSLFVQPGKFTHNSFAQHIVAEELVTEFAEGKGSKTYWNVVNANNHWLDATYNAAAAGRFSGVHLLSEADTPHVEPREITPNERAKKQPVKRQQHGTRFKSRPGGWVNGAKRKR